MYLDISAVIVKTFKRNKKKRRIQLLMSAYIEPLRRKELQ
jgi:hypothetical protein